MSRNEGRLVQNGTKGDMMCLVRRATDSRSTVDFRSTDRHASRGRKHARVAELMAEMNENPYQSPRSVAVAASGFALWYDGSHVRTVKGAAWAGAKVGVSIGAALGVATDLALVLIVSYAAPASSYPWQKLAYLAGICVLFILLPTLVGALGVSFGFGFFAAIERLAQRRRGHLEPSKLGTQDSQNEPGF